MDMYWIATWIRPPPEPKKNNSSGPLTRVGIPSTGGLFFHFPFDLVGHEFDDFEAAPFPLGWSRAPSPPALGAFRPRVAGGRPERGLPLLFTGYRQPSVGRGNPLAPVKRP
ncbi:MAG: hypothetical protein Kow0069_23760 [Promethearchaeota archaeon]